MSLDELVEAAILRASEARPGLAGATFRVELVPSLKEATVLKPRKRSDFGDVSVVMNRAAAAERKRRGAALTRRGADYTVRIRTAVASAAHMANALDWLALWALAPAAWTGWWTVDRDAGVARRAELRQDRASAVLGLAPPSQVQQRAPWPKHSAPCQACVGRTPECKCAVGRYHQFWGRLSWAGTPTDGACSKCGSTEDVRADTKRVKWCASCLREEHIRYCGCRRWHQIQSSEHATNF